MSNRIRILSLAFAISLGVLAVAFGASAAPSGLGSARVGSARVGTGPSELAVDPATHTIYVANGYNDNGPNAGGDTVSVIDTQRCEARNVSRCKGPWPTIRVGKLPSGIAVDERTDTVYVASVGGNSVSVFNGATCNAADSSGCGQTPASVPVGLEPLGLYADPANHTVYVANFGAPATGGDPGNSTTVSMINTATCTASDLAACPTTPPPTVTVGGTPSAVAADPATATAYVTTIGKGLQNGWSVFNATTCNATVQSGCGSIGRLPGDPVGPSDGEVDEANNTLYATNVLWAAQDAHIVYVLDGATCDAADHAGCGQKPATIIVGDDPRAPVVDPGTDTIYIPNHAAGEYAATVSVITGATCDAVRHSGCHHQPPASPVGFGAIALAVDRSSHRVYSANLADGSVSVIDGATCNSRHHGGCRKPAVKDAVGNYPAALAVDPGAGSAHVANVDNTVSVLALAR